MALSKEEAKQLKALQDKAKEPDAPSVARSVNVSIDLGDEAQVARAVKLGFLPGGDDDGDGDGDGDEEDDDDDAPERRGYFGGS